MFVQLVTINVKSGSRTAFLNAIRINLEGTRQEPGNVRFDLLVDPDDETLFSIYEVFESESALEAHRQQPHYTYCMAQLGPMITGEITKQLFTPEII